MKKTQEDCWKSDANRFGQNYIFNAIIDYIHGGFAHSTQIIYLKVDQLVNMITTTKWKGLIYSWPFPVQFIAVMWIK